MTGSRRAKARFGLLTSIIARIAVFFEFLHLRSSLLYWFRIYVVFRWKKLHHLIWLPVFLIVMVLVIEKITSTPVIWTGVYPHMPIADDREIQIVYNTGRHRPCGGQLFTTHMVRSYPASLSHRANDRQTCYRFFIFDLGGLPLGQSSPKGEMACYPPRSTIVQISARSCKRSTRYALPKFFFHFFDLGGLTPGPKFIKVEMTWWTSRSTTLQHFIALCQPTPEISVTKNPANKQTNRKTVTDISPACLSACGDNKYASYPDWRKTYPPMPIANHREIQIVYHTGRHWPYRGQFFTSHMVHSCPASLSHRANDNQTCYRFFNFWPWGLTPGQKFTKRGNDLLSTQIYHPTKFQPDRANDLQDMRYQFFFHFLV